MLLRQVQCFHSAIKPSLKSNFGARLPKQVHIRRWASTFRFGPNGELIVDNTEPETSRRPDPSTLRAQSLFKFRHEDKTPMLKDHDFMYDVVVIGGGSGGLATARESARLGAKVALLDYVFPSPIHASRNNSNTGLGGTCVNMGCIPKLLAHHGSLYGESFRDSEYYGWREIPRGTHDWYTLVKNIENVRMGNNFSYKTVLRLEGVDYANGMASFVDQYTLQLKQDENANGSSTDATISSKHFIISPGGYPRLLDIPGIELSITSDDIFSLPHRPGKTVIVGGGYIALECAGFLHALGYDVTILLRSIPLRGFDREYSEKVLKHLEDDGVKVIREAVPTSIYQRDDSECNTSQTTAVPKNITWEYVSGEKPENNEIPCDTVLMAVGRDARTDALALENAGVDVCERTGKVHVDPETNRTSCTTIFAVGDAAKGKAELTPVAIKEGTAIARQIFQSKNVSQKVVPTTVFTPLEYSSAGLSEEDAKKQYGDENIEVYHTNFTPTQWGPALHRPKNRCSCKAIVAKDEHSGDFENGLVIGLHYFGPNAGEVMQGFATAMQMGMKFSDLRETIGIHPTCAEEFIDLSVTKSSGENPDKQTCCG